MRRFYGQPLRGDTDVPRMDVIGVLVRDATCPLATHVLLNPCTKAPSLYVAFQPNKNVDRFEGYIPVAARALSPPAESPRAG